METTMTEKIETVAKRQLPMQEFETEAEAWERLAIAFQAAGSAAAQIDTADPLRSACGLCGAIAVLAAAGAISPVLRVRMGKRMEGAKPIGAHVGHWWPVRHESSNLIRARFCRRMAAESHEANAAK